ncbi:MAG: Ldh family oxidoreductase [Halanaerobiales bacterium]
MGEKEVYLNNNGLAAFSKDILMEVGLLERDAGIVSESLIDANLRGVDTHGITRLPIYTKRLKEGVVNKNPRMKLEQSMDTVAILDGDNGQGQVVGMRAVEEASRMADEKGTGFVGVKHSNHFGTAAFFGMKIMEEDQIGLVFSNAPSTMVPFGGSKPFFGTNPLAVTIPTGEELPIVIDMATSVVAQGKIILADKEGKGIPEGWAVDKDGNPTTDTKAALDGAVLPLGGPKGSALALLVDILSGVLTGAFWGPHLNNMWTDFENPQNVGHFIGAINIAGLLPLEMFKERVDQIIREIKNVPPAPGYDEVYLPGEIEYKIMEDRLERGIPIGEGVYSELVNLGEKYGKDFESYIK